MSQADLLHGAQLQLRGALRMKDFDRRRIPTRGLEAVLLPKELKANLDKIVHHEKVGGLWYSISQQRLLFVVPMESSAMAIIGHFSMHFSSEAACLDGLYFISTCGHMFWLKCLAASIGRHTAVTNRRFM